MLGGSRMLRQYVRSLVVRGYSPYATAWQAALTGDLEEPICKRTNTNSSALYLFLVCTRPPDPEPVMPHRTARAPHVRLCGPVIARPHVR